MVPMAKSHGAVGLAQPIKLGLYPWISVLLKGRAKNLGVRATVVAREKLRPTTTVSNKAIWCGVTGDLRPTYRPTRIELGLGLLEGVLGLGRDVPTPIVSWSWKQMAAHHQPRKTRLVSE